MSPSLVKNRNDKKKKTTKVFIGSFFAALGALEGKSLPQIGARLRDDLPSTVRSNWILWVPANFVNFRFVPVPLQVAFSNFVALFWNTYVSFVSNRPLR